MDLLVPGSGENTAPEMKWWIIILAWGNKQFPPQKKIVKEPLSR